MARRYDDYDDYCNENRIDAFDWDTCTEDEMERELSRIEGDTKIHLMFERRVLDDAGYDIDDILKKL